MVRTGKQPGAGAQGGEAAQAVGDLASAGVEGAGRYAPSPSGDLHLGNLRTAVLAWLFAKHEGREFRMRIDDIDAQRSSEESAKQQLLDLATMGIGYEGRLWRQQECWSEYEKALQALREKGLVYECYCSRKDIAEAVRAPHAAPGAYPGTCRDLGESERAAKRAELAARGRVPALRLRAGVDEWEVRERFAVGAGSKASDGEAPGSERLGRESLGGEYAGGVYRGAVDDMVLRRGGNVPKASAGENAGASAGGNAVAGAMGGDAGAGADAPGGPVNRDYAYNLAVVVDDALAGVGQVVRGDDLLSSAPRQAYLAHLLGLPPVEYVHVPLVLGPDGKRLAKRDGAVTLRDFPGGAEGMMRWIAESLGEAVDISAAEAAGATGAAAESGAAEAAGATGTAAESGAAETTGAETEAAGAAGGITPAALLPTFRPELLPREPVIWRPAGTLAD